MSELSTPGGRGDPSPPGGFPIVEAIGISKRYGATVALSDAHIRVMPGESHALVGRNGAGKSTLVGILTGLREPDSGEVRFSGEPAPPVSDREALATECRLRLSAFDHHSRPDGRREPPDQSPAHTPRLHQLERVASSGARHSRPVERAGIGGHARRRPQGRGAPARGDRPRALVRRPLHHPR